MYNPQLETFIRIADAGRFRGFPDILPAVFVYGNRVYFLWKFVKNRGIILMLK